MIQTSGYHKPLEIISLSIKLLPTLEVMKVKIDELENDILKVSVVRWIKRELEINSKYRLEIRTRTNIRVL